MLRLGRSEGDAVDWDRMDVKFILVVVDGLLLFSQILVQLLVDKDYSYF